MGPTHFIPRCESCSRALASFATKFPSATFPAHTALGCHCHPTDLSAHAPISRASLTGRPRRARRGCLFPHPGPSRDAARGCSRHSLALSLQELCPRCPAAWLWAALPAAGRIPARGHLCARKRTVCFAPAQPGGPGLTGGVSLHPRRQREGSKDSGQDLPVAFQNVKGCPALGPRGPGER